MPVEQAPLLVTQGLARTLLKLYAYPDPRRPGRLIRGYDCPHALRTARMCAALALRLGYTPRHVRQFQIACLLHDLGRAGLDWRLFGSIWSWARRHGIPTRPAEWRAVYPRTPEGRETEAFLAQFRHRLETDGIAMDAWACEQVEMRLGYARRLTRRLRVLRPRLRKLRLDWSGWMERIMLYYYYPDRLNDAPGWVRQLAEILVACEQFEAHSNRRRGRDYYARATESLSEAFAYLSKLEQKGTVSRSVVTTVRELVVEGAFDTVIHQARGRSVSSRERAVLRAGMEQET
ncbi:hypothetical protein YTPLAS18_08570 [Nitrospira sp.]|nr:hypothetical protein YTPLAS18_08570 [Nitrospira sp.]